MAKPKKDVSIKKKSVYFRAERQVNPALKNYYQVDEFYGLSDSNFFLICVDEQTLELLNSLKEPKYHARWLQESGTRIESQADKDFVDYLWDKLEGQLADTVMLQHLVRAQLLQYSALTGEEVNLDLRDPDNILNSTDKFTSSTPFYVPKLFAPDMSLANALYRGLQGNRGSLYNAQYSDTLYGTSLADLIKQLKEQAAQDPTLLQQIADTLTAVNNTATSVNGVTATTATTANNTAANQAAISQLLTDLVAKGGDAAILQSLTTAITDNANMGQAVKDLNTLYNNQLTALLNELKVQCECNNNGDLDKLKAMITTMETVQGVASAISATAMTAEAAAEWAQLGLQSVETATEAAQLGLEATMAVEETMDKLTDEVRDVVQSIAQAATALGAIGTALGTWAGAMVNAAGFLSVRNAIQGTTNELVKLNANIGGPGSGEGWFAWLKYNLWGGTPPASYQPSLNEIAAAHLQATREMNEVQGGNPNLNDASSIDYIGDGSGQSDA